MKQIIPSIIAKDQKELEERVGKVKDFDVLQLDVMDGKFVENESLCFDFNLPEGHTYEAHLMMEDPTEWIVKNGSKVDFIIFHIENIYDIESLIDNIKNLGKKVGLALNPETPIETIAHCLDKVDQVLIMTVIPGSYGAEFIPATLEKVKELWAMNTEIDIEVDGGITQDTISEASLAGANKFVVGSYLQKSSDVNKAAEELKQKY